MFAVYHFALGGLLVFDKLFILGASCEEAEAEPHKDLCCEVML